MAVTVGDVLLPAGWLAGWWLLWRVPLLAPAGAGGGTTGTTGAAGATGTAGAASVVVPARNEEATLPVLLASLAGEEPFETIVVDDHSTDATAAVAAAGGARVLPAPPLPEGWTGKCWAAHQGASAATGEVLVFFDADTRLEPGALRRLLAAAGEVGPDGLLSVAPWSETPRPYERLSAYFAVVAVMGTGLAALRPGTRVVGAFGPCLICRADAYRAVGGHAAVRGEILDDLALAARFPKATVVGGAGAVSYRMYPGGLRQLVEGWGKNIASGAGATPPGRLALVVAWVAASILAARAGFGALLGDDPLAGTITYGAFAGQLFAMVRQLGSFGAATAVAFPLPLLAFLAVFVRSLVATARGEVRWKGRQVRTR